jgi:hypothetical protein
VITVLFAKLCTHAILESSEGYWSIGHLLFRNNHFIGYISIFISIFSFLYWVFVIIHNSKGNHSFFISTALFILIFLGYQILYMYEWIEEYNLPCGTGCIEFHDLTGILSFWIALFLGGIAFVFAAVAMLVIKIIKNGLNKLKFFYQTFDFIYSTLLFLFIFFNSLNIKIPEFLRQ